MPLLAYCLTEAGLRVKAPLTGVQSSSVRTVCESALNCFVSEYQLQDAGEHQNVKQLALAFHRVLREIFQQAAIIPFRFPTLLQDEEQVRSLMREHAEEYVGSLARLRDGVQMEVHLSFPAEASLAQKGVSGAQYLRERQERRRRLATTADGLRRQLAPHTRDWLQKETAQGIRCYALTKRSSIQDFLRQLERSQVSSEILARATGPWPTTEFLKEK